MTESRKENIELEVMSRIHTERCGDYWRWAIITTYESGLHPILDAEPRGHHDDERSAREAGIRFVMGYCPEIVRECEELAIRGEKYRATRAKTGS